MGIKVELKDGTVEVGGNFQNALRWVKSWTGRTYNRDTRTWTVPATLKEFDARNRFPMDIISGNGDNNARHQTGNHHTRYGNIYTADEWDGQKKVWKAEREVGGKYAQDHADNSRQFKDELEALGVSAAGIRMLRAHIWDFEDAEDHLFNFSSQARRDGIFAIVEAHRNRELVAWEREEGELNARTCKIWEQAGIL